MLAGRLRQVSTATPSRQVVLCLFSIVELYEILWMMNQFRDIFIFLTSGMD